MLRAWGSPEFRTTVDIDFLGITSNEESSIMAQMREILSVSVGPDGLLFEPDSVRTERITENAAYEGLRVRFTCLLDTARINMRIDIGFGDILYPSPEEIEYPALLDAPAPRILCYSRESLIAEKFEAIITLGLLNSRMKDFHDIWLLARQFNFKGERLQEAIRLTFNRRGTSFPEKIPAFTEEFKKEKQVQWSAFRRRLRLQTVPDSFKEVVDLIEVFIAPLLTSVLSKKQSPQQWIAPGPWK